jgi:hypothetical protein
MPTYSIVAPNGKTYTIQGPPGARQDEVVAEILRRDPSAAIPASKERSWKESATDVGAGIVSGVGAVAQLPGQLYGLATGDMDNVSTRAGQSLKDAATSMKSSGLKARERERTAKVEAATEAKGQMGAFKTSLYETISDPGLMLNFVAEQLPNLIPGLGAARVAGMTAKGAASAAVRSSAAAGAGAVQQGADVGAQTYDRLVKELVGQGLTKEQAAEGAINLARATGASAAVISLLANKYMPGGKAIEDVLAGTKTGRGIIGGAATGMAKSIPSENVEEVGGALAGNVAMRQIKPDQELSEGLGETAGMATVGAIGMGGVTGAIGGRGELPPDATDPARGENLPALQQLKAFQDEGRAKAEAARARAEEAAKPIPEDRDQLSLLMARLDPKDPKRKLVQEKITQLDTEAVVQRRAQKEQKVMDAERAKTSAFADPQAQVEPRDAVIAGGPPVAPTPAVPEPKLRRKNERPAAPPPAAPTPAPTAPTNGPLDPDAPIDAQVLSELLPPGARKARAWFDANIMGKTQREVSALVAANPDWVKGNAAAATALRELTSNAAASYVEPPAKPGPGPAPGGPPAESSVGTPAPAAAGTAQPPADTQGTAAPDTAGVGTVQPAAGSDVVAKRPPAPALATQDQLVESVETAKTDEDYSTALEALAAAWTDPARTDKAKINRYVEKSVDGSAAFRRDFNAAQARVRTKKRLTKPESKAEPGRTQGRASLVQAVRSGDARAALQDIASGPGASPLDQLVANRLLAMRSLPKISEQSSLEQSGEYDALNDRVNLRDIDTHSVLHEVVHSAVHRLIAAVEGTELQNAGVRKLRAVYEHVAKVRPDLADTYGMQDLSEFSAEAMSNGAFQRELQTIPYQRTNAFTAFARSVLTMLGISNTSENTALAEALIAVDSMITDGRAMQEAETGKPVVGALVDAKGMVRAGKITRPGLERIVATSELMKAQQGPVQRAYLNTLEFLDNTQGLSPMTKFRAYATDNMAAVAQVFDSVWGGKIRSSLGQINPLLLLRDVQDFTKKLESLYSKGGITYSAQTNTFESAEVAGVPSMVDIWNAEKAWGESKGLNFEEAHATISKMLEAVRLDDIRTTNAAGITDLPIHELSQKDGRDADTQLNEMLALAKAEPDVLAIGDMMTKSREHLIDFMRDQGRITAEQATAWKQNPTYVPFDRVADLEAATFKPTSRGKRGMASFQNRAELVGTTTREVGNVIDNHLNLISWMAHEGAKARATRHALYTLAGLGAAKRVRAKPTDAREARRAVRTFERGEEVWFLTNDPLYALAFQEVGLNPTAFTRGLQSIAQVLRSTITLMPPFILSQVQQDIIRGMIQSGLANPWVLPRQILKNFAVIAWADITGKRHPLVDQLGAKGIAGGFDLDIKDPATSALQELGFRKRSKVGWIARKADGLLRASDLAVRAAIYESTLAETQDAAMALQRGREIINFRRRGASSTLAFLTSTVPFMNAYLQSMDLLYRNAMGIDNSMGISRNEARARLVQQLAVVTAFSMMYALMLSDDDEYNEMDLRQRGRHFIIPGMDVKIPVPPEWAAITKVPAEMFVEYIRRQGTPEELYAMEAVKVALGTFAEATMGPTPIPSALKPGVEALMNFSLFTMSPIEGTYQKTLDPSQRSTYRTSEMSKAIAEIASAQGFEVSPIMIDHLVQGYFATVGTTLLAATDGILNPDRMDRPLHKMFLAQTFTYDPVGTRIDQEFYDFAEKVMPKVRTLQSLQSSDPEKAEAYAEKHEEELAVGTYVGAMIQKLGDLRKYEKYLRSNLAAKENMTQEQRETALEELRKERSLYLRDVRELKTEYYARKSAKP